MVLFSSKTVPPSLKRPSSSAFVPPFANRPKHSGEESVAGTLTPVEKMTVVLAEAGCTLGTSPPCLPSDTNKLRHRLDRLFAADPELRSVFLSGFSTYIYFPLNFHRVLVSTHRDGTKMRNNESLVRVLLLVPSIQLELQIMLLEKLPEYFATTDGLGISSSSSIESDIAGLALNQLRWLDFLVDSKVFGEKLFEVLSICPFSLKKEIIGSLPEIIGDQNNEAVVESLKQMLEEDSSIIVSVLDSFSNLVLDEHLQEQVISIALSCIRTTEAEHMPCLLRFLLLSATTTNARKIIAKIREQLKLVGMPNALMTQKNRLKGKAPAINTDASILDALRSSLLFKNTLCEEILKEIKSVERAQDHKLIDLWLLMLIYMNGESLKRKVEKIFKKKIIEGCIQDVMFDQCIYAKKELVQDYFRSFLSLAEYLLGCKEEKPSVIGVHIYILLFKEFTDTCSRQEVLGSLVTHVGSGISFEVTSAMEAMFMLASKYSEELFPFSSHISGILDYLEVFSVENLHKVYDVFILLAMSSRSSAESFGGSIRNELLMIVRKQVSNSDLKYKKMGLIGTLKVVACLGDSSKAASSSSSQKSNYEEALELLKTSMESCKQLPLPLIMFYDELSSVVDYGNLHPAIMEWIGKHVGEFESLFLSDLEGGKLPNKDSFCGLEGELWMNLDGDISPVCMNILPLVSASMQSASLLQSLPAKFLLLSVIERVANNGSLEGIDALIGCPLHLPSFKIFSETIWQSLNVKQKEVICLSLYYAANWIRELLNAFCTQVSGRFDCIAQASKDEIIPKLFKRLRNLVFLESLLNNCLKKFPTSLPDLHPHVEHFASSLLNQTDHIWSSDKGEHIKHNGTSSPKRKKKKEIKSKGSISSDVNGKFKQPTIMDVLIKAGAIPSQDGLNQMSSGPSSKDSLTEPTAHNSSDSSEVTTVEISEAAKILEAQRYKFRPLLVDSFAILISSEIKDQDSCCADPAAELPLHLYLLRDLHYKLDYFSPANKPFSARFSSNPAGLSRMPVNEFLSQLRPLFPGLRKHLNSAVHILKKGDEACQEHWTTWSTAAVNPNLTSMVLSNFSVCTSISKEILFCFSKILTLPAVRTEKSVLSDILEAFQPTKSIDCIFSEMKIIPSPGNLDYLYCGAYFLLEEILEEALNFSFTVASEVLLTLNSIISCLQQFLHNSGEGSRKEIQKPLSEKLFPAMNNRLGSSAHKFLKHDWDSHNLENGWKGKGEVVQRVLQIYLLNNESTSDLLVELACSVLPEAPLSRITGEDFHGYPTLCSATFLIWYRVMHEENLAILNKLVKEVIIKKPRPGFQHETVTVLLHKLQKSVHVIVSLVIMCRTHEKVSVHAMAVKYGGKFIDSFLKAFEFLQAQFSVHNELILQIVKELQKATRTLQALCSEAKGLKQTAITIKIPSTKRSLERFLFHVKALLHSTPNGCTFWMGNLKHKDLTGHVVSSQAYVDEQSENGVEDFEETVVEDQHIRPASGDEQEPE